MKGYDWENLFIISSPFIRTLQTAAYFGSSLISTHIPNSKKSKKELNIICNNNIVVILGKTAKAVFKAGVLKTKGKKAVLKDWLDSMATSIS